MIVQILVLPLYLYFQEVLVVLHMHNMENNSNNNQKDNNNSLLTYIVLKEKQVNN